MLICIKSFILKSYFKYQSIFKIKLQYVRTFSHVLRILLSNLENTDISALNISNSHTIKKKQCELLFPFYISRLGVYLFIICLCSLSI